MKNITSVQAIIFLIAANLIMTGILLSDLNYAHITGTSNQKSILSLLNDTHHLINNQGNISSTQRTQILHEFTALQSQGGFSTHQQIVENNHLLTEILGNLTKH